MRSVVDLGLNDEVVNSSSRRSFSASRCVVLCWISTALGKKAHTKALSESTNVHQDCSKPTYAIAIIQIYAGETMPRKLDKDYALLPRD